MHLKYTGTKLIYVKVKWKKVVILTLIPVLLCSAGLWTLHAREGWNIQLHFLYFDVEATYDVVEVRDGSGPDSRLLGQAYNNV